MIPRPAISLPLLVSLTLVGCALPPPATDVQLGEQIADAMEKQVGVYRDPALERWLRGVAGRVVAEVAESPFSYRFGILDQPEPNAFAAPGGFVYVSRGLLALAQSEDEVAAVLGHEVVHVEERHTAQRLNRGGGLPALLKLPGQVIGVVSKDLGDLINSPIEGLAAMRMASYGRGQESESDRIGQELVARAGYDPAALGPILARMEVFAATVTGESAEPSYFDSHPPTPERVREAADRAASLEVAPRPVAAEADAAGFARRIDGMVFGPNPARGELRDRTFVHPLLGIALTFPPGWDLVQTAEAVGAIAPGDESFVFYGVAAREVDGEVEWLAAERRELMRSQRGLEPSRDEARTLADGRTARLLSYTDGEGADLVHMFFVWVPFEGFVHQLVGVARDAHRIEIRSTVESLRALTERERGSFRVQRLRIVRARDGEHLAHVATRSGNVAPLSVLEALNDVDAGAALAGEQQIKVVCEEPLFR